MAVYVDDAIWRWRDLRWCHLLADHADELHRFAALLGIRRTSFQCPPKTTTPHYDLTGYERVKAIALGAVTCNRHDIVAVCRRLRHDSARPLQPERNYGVVLPPVVELPTLLPFPEVFQP